MSSRIKGITIQIGADATKLDEALRKTETNLRLIQKDLKEVEKGLRLDPGNTELLAQKQRLLSEALEESRNKFNLLNDAAEQMNRQLSEGRISTEQYNNFNLELDLARSNLNAAEQAVASFNAELSQIQSSASSAESGLGGLSSELDQLESSGGGAAGAVSEMGESAGGIGTGFSIAKGVIADLVASGIKFLINAAKEAVEWLWSLDEATAEYRENMGKLNTSFETAGYSAEIAQRAYNTFYQILGDSDTATEASQLLAQLAKSEEEVATWTKIAAGVYGTFGDSLPIEGLIEAANETAKTGQVTGVLADAINWIGQSEDEFNDALAKTSDEGERAQLIMNNLAGAYDDAAQSYRDNNEAIMESREVQSELDEAMAAVGESVAGVKAELWEAFGPMILDALKLAAGIFDKIAAAIHTVIDAMDWLIDKIKTAIDFFQRLGGAGGQVSGAASGAKSSRSSAQTYSANLTSMDVPYLADGAVARRNNPFLAVVGDNPQEDEIISPYSTIKQAAMEAIRQSGMTSGGGKAQNITMTLDGRTVARLLMPYLDGETNRLGVQLAPK